MIDFAAGSAPLGSPGYRLPLNFVAMTSRSRRALCRPTWSPMIFSEWLFV
jgi:hypothetical protein